MSIQKKPPNIDSSLTETRTVTLTLFGTTDTDFEEVLGAVEDVLRDFDESGTELDWNIEVEA